MLPPYRYVCQRMPIYPIWRGQWWNTSVVGADATLKRNLATFFQLDYPNRFVEIVFCVPSANDSSLPIIAELRAEFPELQSSISIGTATAGINPKINNIGAMIHVSLCCCIFGATRPFIFTHLLPQLQVPVLCVGVYVCACASAALRLHLRLSVCVSAPASASASVFTTLSVHWFLYVCYIQYFILNSGRVRCSNSRLDMDLWQWCCNSTMGVRVRCIAWNVLPLPSLPRVGLHLWGIIIYDLLSCDGITERTLRKII